METKTTRVEQSDDELQDSGDLQFDSALSIRGCHLTTSLGSQLAAQNKRKEKARIAARARRSQEASIILEMANELYITQEKIRRIDKATIVKLAIDYIKAFEILCRFRSQSKSSSIISTSSSVNNNINMDNQSNYSIDIRCNCSDLSSNTSSGIRCCSSTISNSSGDSRASLTTSGCSCSDEASFCITPSPVQPTQTIVPPPPPPSPPAQLRQQLQLPRPESAITTTAIITAPQTTIKTANRIQSNKRQHHQQQPPSTINAPPTTPTTIRQPLQPTHHRTNNHYNQPQQQQQQLFHQHNHHSQQQQQKPHYSAYSAPKLSTRSIFGPKTDDMDSYFLMISDGRDGSASFVLKPDTEILDDDDLTHLAPQAGDESISLDVEPLDGIVLDTGLFSSGSPPTKKAPLLMMDNCCIGTVD